MLNKYSTQKGNAIQYNAITKKKVPPLDVKFSVSHNEKLSLED